MLETIRELSREVKLQNLVINSFVPAEYQVSVPLWLLIELYPVDHCKHVSSTVHLVLRSCLGLMQSGMRTQESGTW